MRFLRWIIPLSLLLGLLACGPPRKSVFPPTLTIQQLQVEPNGALKVTLRIQNNSYGEMGFRSLEGQLAFDTLQPVRLHGAFARDIPAFAGDVVMLELLPTAPMRAALAASAATGSAGSLGYTISGVVRALPEQDKTLRDFDFHGIDRISPVPGVAATWR